MSKKTYDKDELTLLGVRNYIDTLIKKHGEQYPAIGYFITKDHLTDDVEEYLEWDEKYLSQVTDEMYKEILDSHWWAEDILNAIQEGRCEYPGQILKKYFA